MTNEERKRREAIYRNNERLQCSLSSLKRISSTIHIWMEYEEKLRNNPLADEVKDSYRGLEVTFHKIIEAETAYLLSLNAPAPEEQS